MQLIKYPELTIHERFLVMLLHPRLMKSLIFQFTVCLYNKLPPPVFSDIFKPSISKIHFCFLTESLVLNRCYIAELLCLLALSFSLGPALIVYNIASVHEKQTRVACH